MGREVFRHNQDAWNRDAGWKALVNPSVRSGLSAARAGRPGDFSDPQSTGASVVA